MKFYLITFGCQMNKSDSERIAGLLLNLGWKEAEKPGQADLIVINTCSVRQSAENRVFGQVRNLAKLKQKNPNLIIAITGCMPGRDKNGRLKAKMPKADLWFSIKDLPKLPQMLKRVTGDQIRGDSCSNIDLINTICYLQIQPRYENKFQAFVPIQTGCNQYCAYCVVPMARGFEQSRPLKNILKEINSLANQGCVEITLLGQTVNNYQAPDAKIFSKGNPYLPRRQAGKNHFASLLWEINQIPAIKWIHFTAPHPIYMSDEVIDALTLPKQVNYLHLPLQSGDNQILQQMNRGYSREFYLDLIKKIQAKKPDIALGTDIIVGFPGETKKQFQKTVDLYKKVKFDIAYLAMYSQRSGTLAGKKFQDNVSPKEKKRRWNVLQELMEQTTLKKNQKYLGKTLEVLVEQPNLGHSREMKQVRLKGSKNLIGRIVKVKINQALTWELRGVNV